MKFEFRVPSGFIIRYETRDLDKDRYYAKCITICVVAVALGFFAMLIFK